MSISKVFLNTIIHFSQIKMLNVIKNGKQHTILYNYVGN